MSSKTNTFPIPLRNLTTRTKRSPTHSRRRRRRRHCAALRPPNADSSSSDVSAKLDALQSLIPAKSPAATARQTDQLFKETADYIVLLKTQVLILQQLVDFFGSACSDPQNAVVS